MPPDRSENQDRLLYRLLLTALLTDMAATSSLRLRLRPPLIPKLEKSHQFLDSHKIGGLKETQSFCFTGLAVKARFRQKQDQRVVVQASDLLLYLCHFSQLGMRHFALIWIE